MFIKYLDTFCHLNGIVVNRAQLMERGRRVFHGSASGLQTASEGNTNGPQEATEMHLAVWSSPGCVAF